MEIHELEELVKPYQFHFDFLHPDNPSLRLPWETGTASPSMANAAPSVSVPEVDKVEDVRQVSRQGLARGFLCKTSAASKKEAAAAKTSPSGKSKKKAAGHYWDTPPPRFEFKEKSEIKVGDWSGLEQRGQVRKAATTRKDGNGVCRFSCLQELVPADTAAKILEYLKKNPKLFSSEPDSVDKTPTFEFYPFRDGVWKDQELRELLEEMLEARILTYVRQRYNCRFCAASDVLVRRYIPGERRSHAVHFDGHAYVTAVLGISDPENYQGGLYIQPDPGVASRTYFRIEPGDLLVHSFDLQHGVHVWKGIRYSLVFWIKDSLQAVREGTTPWYHGLAEQDDPDALYNLAQNYEYGLFGHRKDISKAIELYERSAQTGHHFAQNNLALVYRSLCQNTTASESQQLLQKSVEWLQAAAKAGFGMAQKNLALAYTNGQGLRRDDAQAVVWMRRAAEQLEVEAAYLMGELHRQGRGVQLSEAVKWYLRSAEAGFPKAQYTLGMLYLEGTGLPQDSHKAEMWLNFAARQGHPEAKNNIATMHAQRGEVEEALKIWEDLAESGEPNAQCNMGMAYLRGAGRPHDASLAAEWLGKAAAQGHQMALQALAAVA